MGHLDTIEKAAQKLIALCQKEKQTKTDKKKMLGIHAEILASIENLAECELCGAITEMIVTMTLADITAKLCKECGVKSLETGKIQASKQGTSRKKTAPCENIRLLPQRSRRPRPVERLPNVQHPLKNQKLQPHYILGLKHRPASRKPM